MPLHVLAWKAAVKKFGAVYDQDFFYSCKGMKEKDIVPLYNAKHNTNLDPEQVVEAKHEFFSQNIS